MEKKKIVIAQENRMQAEGIAAAFARSESFGVAGVTTDGLQAVSLVERTEADLCILDLILPSLDGLGVIEKLIAAGVETVEFYCEDPLGAARNIMYVLEGLKVSAHTIGITEKAVDDELLYIMKGLVAEE